MTTYYIANALIYSVQVIGGIAVLFSMSWKVTLLMLCTTPPVAIGAVIYGKYVKSLTRKVQDALADVYTVCSLFTLLGCRCCRRKLIQYPNRPCLWSRNKAPQPVR